MANYAAHRVTFGGVAQIDSSITIVFTKNATNYSRTWTCKAVRSQAFQFAQGITPEDQAIKLLNAAVADIANDLNLPGNWTAISYASTAMQFVALNYGWSSTSSTSGTTNATFVITAEVLPAKNFTLDSIVFTAGTAPCSDVTATITETDGVSPYTWITPSNASTSLVAQIARGASNETVTFTLEDDEADQATIQGVIPQLFTTALITDISVVPNTGGLDATVTAFLSNPDSIFTYQYSIDGTNFSASNVFPNLTDGDYTLYVTDGYGCLITYPFTVDIQNEIVRLDPYEVVPKANSIRFVKRGIYPYRNLDNTLYKNEYYEGQYHPAYSQKYQTTDGEIKTQFRSNYTTIAATLYNCDDSSVGALTLTQKTSNIGAEDKRDCTVFNLGNNQTGIYFTTGNIYDPGTTDIIDTYDLHGNLPEWGVVGNTVVISGMGSFVIKQATYNSSVGANVLVIDYVWTSGSQSLAKIAECTYNRQPYEVYEFSIDPSFLDGDYYVLIEMTDDDYPAVTYESESIQIKPSFRNTNYIEYSGSAFTGIDYTDFVGKLRVKSLDPYHALTPGGEQVTYNDSLFETTKLKDVSTMEGQMFFQEQPRYMIEKLRLAFSHDSIEINGESWVNVDGLDVQNFDKSALRNATIKLRRKNYESYASNFIDLDGQAVVNQEITE